MKNMIRSLFLSALLGSLLCIASNAQSRNTITGFVYNDARAPVANVYVELQTDFYSTVSRIRTPGSGHFTFAGLPSGLYVVKILTSGTNYEEQSRSVSLVPVSVLEGRGSVSEHVEFYLKPRKGMNGRNFGSPSVVFAQDVPDASKDLYTSAMADLEKNDEKAAFDKLKRSIEGFPDYYLALDRLGNEYVLRGHYEAGALLLAKAITVNKRSTSSLFGLGLALFRLNHVMDAVTQFENMLKLDSESANGHLWLGIAQHSLKKFPEALRSLQKANQLTDGTSAEVHWQLARVYKDEGRFDKAAAELELFLKYRPEAENQVEIKQVIASLRKKE